MQAKTIIIYGINNCDTIKKTKNWCAEKKIEFKFYDYKKLGITKEQLANWCKKTDWQILLNKKGTTFKKLLLKDQEKINSVEAAINFMVENTSSIKRPIIEVGKKIIVGFNEEKFKQEFI